MEHLIQLVASLFAALLIMIIHEIPKTLAYNARSDKKIPLSKVFYLPQYIDPIGLIFCVFSLAGFSKPYRYEFKDKKNAIYIGLIGLLSLMLCTILAYVAYRFFYTNVGVDELLTNMNIFHRFDYYFVCHFLLISFSMFIVNLFPVSAFDMGLIIAGTSIQKFIRIIRMDTLVKLALAVVLFTEAIPLLGIKLVNLLLSL